jgi:hypothetical protein
VLTLPLPPPQPAHIKTSTVTDVRASHVGRLARPARITSRANMSRVARSRPTRPTSKCNRRDTGRTGIDFGTRGAKATAVVGTLIVAVTADVPAKGKEAGDGVQFTPIGAAEHASAIVPLKPPADVKTSE